MAHAYLKAPEFAVFQRCRKFPFPSRAIAMRALRGWRRTSPDVQHGTGRWNAYRCRVCGGFHLGHRRI